MGNGNGESSKNDFLIKEYETAVALTSHVDVVRNNLTNFFLIFAGAAVTVSGILLKAPETAARLDQSKFTGAILLLVSGIGVCFVGVLARLRRVQLERYAIANRIRQYLLAGDSDRLSAVGLSKSTLPVETHGERNRKTGTYLWLLTIMVPSACLFSFGLYVLLQDFLPLDGPSVALATIYFFLLVVAFLAIVDNVYWQLSHYVAPALSDTQVVNANVTQTAATPPPGPE
jgi:hypothetical protein